MKFALSLFVGFVFLLIGCTSKPKPCNPANCIRPDEIAIDEINFLIEASSSMFPFIESNNFRSSVLNAYVVFENLATKGKINNFVYHESPVIQKISGLDYRESISQGKLAKGSSSEIQKMLGDCISLADSSKGISVLVSDLIFYPKGATQLSHRTEKLPLFKSTVKSIFSDYSKRNGAITIFSFQTNISDTLVRPFYIIVFGKKNQVASITKKLLADKSFQPTDYTSFGVEADKINDYNLFVSGNKSTSCKSAVISRAKNEVLLQKASPNNCKTYMVSFDDYTLPDYAKSEKYILENLHFDGPDLSKIKIKAESVIDISDIKLNTPEGCFHSEKSPCHNRFIKIIVEQQTLASADVKLKLKNNPPIVKPFSKYTYNLIPAIEDKTKTLGLSEIVEALVEVYPSMDNLLEISIHQTNK